MTIQRIEIIKHNHLFTLLHTQEPLTFFLIIENIDTLISERPVFIVHKFHIILMYITFLVFIYLFDISDILFINLARVLN